MDGIPAEEAEKDDEVLPLRDAMEMDGIADKGVEEDDKVLPLRPRENSPEGRETLGDAASETASCLEGREALRVGSARGRKVDWAAEE